MAGDLVLAHGGRDNIPANFLEVRASHVTIDITASAGREKGLFQEWERLAQFKTQVETLASASNLFSVHRVASTYQGREAKSSFGSYGSASNYRLRVATTLRDDESFITAAKRLNSFITKLQPHENIEFRVGSYSLALQQPRQYREALLKSLSEEIESAKSALGPGYKAKIYDFTDNLLVQQSGEDTVSVFFNYEVEFEQ